MTIHKINKERFSDEEGFTNSAGDVEDVVGYTTGNYGGKSTPNIDPLSDDCFAKEVLINGESGPRSKYYIKMGASGFMFNPWGLFSEGTQGQFAKHSGKDVWEFREVNSKSFEYYLKFLRTRNNAWINNAEREVRDG